jgi:hypothetical protein
MVSHFNLQSKITWEWRPEKNIVKIMDPWFQAWEAWEKFRNDLRNSPSLENNSGMVMKGWETRGKLWNRWSQGWKAWGKSEAIKPTLQMLKKFWGCEGRAERLGEFSGLTGLDKILKSWKKLLRELKIIWWWERRPERCRKKHGTIIPGLRSLENILKWGKDSRVMTTVKTTQCYS